MSSTTTKICHPDGTVLECTTTAGGGSGAPCTGSAIVYGMSVSGNVIPPVLIALDTGCGKEDTCDIMQGQQMTPEFLAMNPFHQIPMMKDGDFCLGESNAISRYLANKYAPELYGTTPEEKGTCDWALDWCSSNFYKSYSELWYPVAGFGPAPEDYPAACKKAVDNLDIFCEVRQEFTFVAVRCHSCHGLVLQLTVCLLLPEILVWRQ